MNKLEYDRENENREHEQKHRRVKMNKRIYRKVKDINKERDHKTKHLQRINEA